MGLLRILILYIFLVVMPLSLPNIIKLALWYQPFGPQPTQQDASNQFRPSHLTRPSWHGLVDFLSQNGLSAGGHPP